ncbi:hypothetical protein F4808DRAFT_469316 [Astrocystis sublimbata]|nr:hypothetical protein F4808DRAFT_469316 [Astrocystis sublimbata]
MPPSTGVTTLVVGIDFGTTYSGVSWLICKPGSQPGQPEVVSLWQTSIDNRRKNSDSQKVPSVMYYNQAGQLSWGFKIPAGANIIQWFKLLLLDKSDLQSHLVSSSHLQDAEKSLAKLEKTAVELVGEYLKELWGHILEQIHNAKGQALINGMPFHVVLTVPAIWGDCARDRMRQAAAIAGILAPRVAGKTLLSFVSEPEAAAIATMPELEDRTDLQAGDTFVVLDAGGGTVDIISYKINKLQPLSVSECVEGALCGGTFLDKEFEAHLKDVVGEAAWNKMNSSDIRRVMNNEWEHGIKEAFDGEPASYMVELPSRAQSAPVEFESIYRSEELQPIFDRIVSQIGVLVKTQISAIKTKTSQPPKLIILVGGFGRSPYVLKYLKRDVGTNITVLQARGDKPWTAICRGAALVGAGSSSANDDHLPKVESRIARLSYGLVYTQMFDPKRHDRRDLFWDDIRGEWRADNQMQWVVRRGENVSTKKAKQYEYYESWPVSTQGWKTCTEAIYACADLNPSSRLGSSIYKVADFTYRPPKPVERYERVWTDETSYREWQYTLKVMISGASFDLTLISDGTEQKSERILISMN